MDGDLYRIFLGELMSRYLKITSTAESAPLSPKVEIIWMDEVHCEKPGCANIVCFKYSGKYCYPHSAWWRPYKVPFNKLMTWLDNFTDKYLGGLKYRDYPEIEESARLTREQGIEAVIKEWEQIKCHNLAVIDRRFKIGLWAVIILILSFNVAAMFL